MPVLPPSNTFVPPTVPYAVITVGTTQFLGLMQVLNKHAKRFVDYIVKFGYSHVILQYGTSPKPDDFELACRESLILTLEVHQFIPNFSAVTQNAGLVISHAGAGTVLEVLRSPAEVRPRLFIITNPDLMDNHQEELATALKSYLYSSSVAEAIDALEAADWDALEPYPARDTAAFAQLLDDELGSAD